MKALIDADWFAYAHGSAKDDEGHPLSWPFVASRINQQIENIVKSSGASEYDLFLTGSGNFREQLATIRPYKGNRPDDKPYHYERVRDYLIKFRNAILVEGMEADDAVSIEQYKSLKENGTRLYLNCGDYVIVDWVTYQWAKDYNWFKNSHGYAIREEGNSTTENRATYFLHREIMKASKGEVVDHINGNKLDNRSCNLRFCTIKENVRSSTSSTGTSKYKGVHWDKEKKKWAATIKVDYQTKFLGRFDSEQVAAASYDTAALMYFGEYAKLNLRENNIVPDFEETVICTIDKDLMMVEGNGYNWQKDERYWIDEISGLRSFYQQLLTGDSVDNILGLFGVGKSSKLLGDIGSLSSELEMYSYVVNQYEKRFGSYWWQFLLENAQLLWMLREEPKIEIETYHYEDNDRVPVELMEIDPSKEIHLRLRKLEEQRQCLETK